jgi:hypothetical protein
MQAKDRSQLMARLPMVEMAGQQAGEARQLM